MRKFFATTTLLGALLPGAVSAATLSDIEMQIKFLLGHVAFLQAQSGNGIGCAIATSKQRVAVGEPYELIWNTYGAVEGPTAYANSGIETIKMDQRGTFQYKMTFVGEHGTEATCTTMVVIG